MNSSNDADGPTSQKTQPWLLPWPADELENVKACPVCGSEQRISKHENLVDNVFFVAPGHWTLHQCLRCRSGYLDPRPNEASIGKAYDTYYTHTRGSGIKRASSELGTLRRLQRHLANDYLNQRYGTDRQPINSWGSRVLKLLPSSRQMLDVEFRYLPKPSLRQKLLDVGCGNGSFLSTATESGWEALGVDPDPKAVAAARKLGFDVRQGSIDSFADMSSCFDVITLSHVIEHVHEPKQMIQSAYRLLKPGGVIYIDTPNMESNGAARFGKNWRGFEAPRHLVLFSLEGLTQMLKTSNFAQIEVKRRSSVRQGTYLRSLRMLIGRSPYAADPAKLPCYLRIKLFFSPIRAKHDEFLTLVARRHIE
jgi:2-polyprenyl-3-methyl-5-hydroxy-6-metoxy-1,4-benzoquinol methylase